MCRRLLAVLILVFTARAALEQGIVSAPVTTSQGDVTGTVDARSLVRSFKGIPFAAPPVGDLRWRPPQPAPHWSKVRRADSFGASCMQTVHKEMLPWTPEFLVQNQVSEDCLFLNVWTPRTVPTARLPVVVFIHGGGFVEGSGAVQVYDGQDLASTGLVVVTLNYRLGIFGFLAHPELSAESPHGSSGDYGLLDQLAALQWVRTNIVAFGGDPNRVTIWGQSAGAFSVGDLLASPLSAGLFGAAIADSGLSLAGASMPTLHPAEAAGAQIAEQLHAPGLRALRAMPAETLQTEAQAMRLHLGPVVDGWVLPVAPNTANANGSSMDVPVLTGFQANDGLLTRPRLEGAAGFHTFAQKQYASMAGEFEQLYPASTAAQVSTALANSTRDRERVAMFLWAHDRAQHHRSPTYTYFFTHGIPWPQQPQFGAFHSGELPYFFRNLWVLDRPYAAVDAEVAQLASAYLKAFVSTGQPSGPELPAWPSVGGVPVTLEIGEDTRVMEIADPVRLRFWTTYFASPLSAAAPVF